jgi:hypothetical protein
MRDVYVLGLLVSLAACSDPVAESTASATTVGGGGATSGTGATGGAGGGGGSGAAPPVGNSPLEMVASSMAPGDFVEFPVPTFGEWLGSYDVAWMSKMYYDPMRHHMWIGGKRAASQGSRMALVEYDGPMDAWQLVYDSDDDGYPLGESLGHIYEALTVDVSTGAPVFKIFNSTNLARFDGSAWVQLNTAEQPNGWSTPAAATAYHPNLFGDGAPGIVVGAVDGIYGYDPATDESTLIAGGWSSGGYTNAINYNPIQDCVFVTKDSTPEIYRVRRASEGAVRIADAPIELGPHSSSAMGKLVSAPGGEELVFERIGSNVWTWVEDPAPSGTWELSSTANPFPTDTGFWFPEHVYARGVIWALVFQDNTAEQPPQSYLWKPPTDL